MISKHFGPGPHPGTGTEQEVHGGNDLPASPTQTYAAVRSSFNEETQIETVELGNGWRLEVMWPHHKPEGKPETLDEMYERVRESAEPDSFTQVKRIREVDAFKGAMRVIGPSLSARRGGKANAELVGFIYEPSDNPDDPPYISVEPLMGEPAVYKKYPWWDESPFVLEGLSATPHSVAIATWWLRQQWLSVWDPDSVDIALAMDSGVRRGHAHGSGKGEDIIQSAIDGTDLDHILTHRAQIEAEISEMASSVGDFIEGEFGFKIEKPFTPQYGAEQAMGYFDYQRRILALDPAVVVDARRAFEKVRAGEGTLTAPEGLALGTIFHEMMHVSAAEDNPVRLTYDYMVEQEEGMASMLADDLLRRFVEKSGVKLTPNDGAGFSVSPPQHVYYQLRQRMRSVTSQVDSTMADAGWAHVYRAAVQEERDDIFRSLGDSDEKREAYAEVLKRLRKKLGAIPIEWGRRAVELAKRLLSMIKRHSMLDHSLEDLRQQLRTAEPWSPLWVNLKTAIEYQLQKRSAGIVTKHYGPGDHPSGSSQDAHAGGKGGKLLNMPEDPVMALESETWQWVADLYQLDDEDARTMRYGPLIEHGSARILLERVTRDWTPAQHLNALKGLGDRIRLHNRTPATLDPRIWLAEVMDLHGPHAVPEILRVGEEVETRLKDWRSEHSIADIKQWSVGEAPKYHFVFAQEDGTELSWDAVGWVERPGLKYREPGENLSHPVRQAQYLLAARSSEHYLPVAFYVRNAPAEMTLSMAQWVTPEADLQLALLGDRPGVAEAKAALMDIRTSSEPSASGNRTPPRYLFVDEDGSPVSPSQTIYLSHIPESDVDDPRERRMWIVDDTGKEIEVSQSQVQSPARSYSRLMEVTDDKELKSLISAYRKTTSQDVRRRIDEEIWAKLGDKLGVRHDAHLAQVLSEYQPFGGTLVTENQRKSPAVILRDMNNGLFPTSWIEASNESRPLVIKVANNVRGHYNDHVVPQVVSVSTSGGYTANNAYLHEMGHRFEHVIPEINALSEAYFRSRTDGEDWVPISRHGYPGADYGELAKIDKWGDAYQGKRYPPNLNSPRYERAWSSPGGGGPSYLRIRTGYEILSMAMPNLYKPVKSLDEETERFVLGMLATVGAP